MPRKPFARISITLPAEVLRAADREAKRVGRSRSWVIAEAIRRGAGAVEVAPAEPVETGRVREAVVSPYAELEGEMAEVRERRLRLALALTPTERLRRADALVRLARAVRPRRERTQVIGFDSFEDYWRWKRAQRASGAVGS